MRKQCGSRPGLTLLVQENSKTSRLTTFVVVGAVSVIILSSYMDLNLIFLINMHQSLVPIPQGFQGFNHLSGMSGLMCGAPGAATS